MKKFSSCRRTTACTPESSWTICDIPPQKGWKPGAGEAAPCFLKDIPAAPKKVTLLYGRDQFCLQSASAWRQMQHSKTFLWLCLWGFFKQQLPLGIWVIACISGQQVEVLSKLVGSRAAEHTVLTPVEPGKHSIKSSRWNPQIRSWDDTYFYF